MNLSFRPRHKIIIESWNSSSKYLEVSSSSILSLLLLWSELLTFKFLLNLLRTQYKLILLLVLCYFKVLLLILVEWHIDWTRSQLFKALNITTCSWEQSHTTSCSAMSLIRGCVRRLENLGSKNFILKLWNIIVDGILRLLMRHIKTRHSAYWSSLVSIFLRCVACPLIFSLIVTICI